MTLLRNYPRLIVFCVLITMVMVMDAEFPVNNQEDTASVIAN